MTLADEVPPALGWHQLGATQIDFASVLIAAAAVAYVAGVVRVNRTPGTPRWSSWRTTAFFGGLAVTFVAVECVVGVYDDVLFYDHMIQHLLLIMVAAPLFCMGAPVELLQRAASGRLGQVVDRSLGSRAAEVAAHPVTAFILYAFLIPFCHLTSFYNLTLTHEQLHDTEHLLFLVIGYLFWRQVVGIEPSRHPLHPGVRLLYLALAVPVDTFTGLTLASASHELFPAYFGVHRTWGPSRLTDLHMGGDIMWVGGDSLMFLAMIPTALRWIRYEDHQARLADEELESQPDTPVPVPWARTEAAPPSAETEPNGRLLPDPGHP